MRTLFLVTAILAASASAQDSGITHFRGPNRYCGARFAVDLKADEQIEIQSGPDFDLEGLISPRGGFGLYEGFAPQNGTGDVKVDAGLPLPTYRVGKAAGDFGYVIWTGTRVHPYFIHVWGAAFKGDRRDYRLLRRLQLGASAKRGCAKPKGAN